MSVLLLVVVVVPGRVLGRLWVGGEQGFVDGRLRMVVVRAVEGALLLRSRAVPLRFLACSLRLLVPRLR
ncbi:hypothetical protein [Streptomyces sp. NPDC093097]|uniref:hypothetical protein n=1 Tax=Streptomyces sp. NPDC093097 TaxID=3366027 RepID=UPI0037FB7450